jgi:hypothetical protein
MSWLKDVKFKIIYKNGRIAMYDPLKRIWNIFVQRKEIVKMDKLERYTQLITDIKAIASDCFSDKPYYSSAEETLKEILDFINKEIKD